MTNELARQPAYWTYFARAAAESPVYLALTEAIAGDQAMQEVAAAARPEQPPANILFAAVHFLLLGGASHPLRHYYSHLLRPGEKGRAPDGALYPAFQDFVAVHRSALDPLIATRVTNTNEVRRCSYLRAGYAEIAARTGLPLAIIEVGPSAGLNMGWDRYAYRYDGARTLHGGPMSSLAIDCAWRGATPPPVPDVPPAAAWRVGLEMSPVDLSREEERRWLQALLWPGQPERLARQKAALDILASDPPIIRSGDALALLPQAIADAPGDAALVVVHSMVTYQFSDEGLAAFEERLMTASRRRTIWHLFQDKWRDVPNVIDFYLHLERWEDGAAVRECLAEVHHHGAWIDWRA